MFSWTDLWTMAAINPRLALLILSSGSKQPRSYNIHLSFTTAAQGTLVTSRLDEVLYNETWIHELAYTVRRPNSEVGAPWRSQDDEYTKRNPYVDVHFRTEGCEKYDLTEGYIPLENIASSSAFRLFAKGPWVLGKNQNIAVDGILQRNLTEPDELPYDVHLTFNTLELSGCECDWRHMEFSTVQCKVREMLQEVGSLPIPVGNFARDAGVLPTPVGNIVAPHNMPR